MCRNQWAAERRGQKSGPDYYKSQLRLSPRTRAVLQRHRHLAQRRLQSHRHVLGLPRARWRRPGAQVAPEQRPLSLLLRAQGDRRLPGHGRHPARLALAWAGIGGHGVRRLDLQDHRFLPNDPNNRLRGTHVGARGGFDIWYEPVRDGMITVSASLSTLGKSYWMRAATGGRLFDMIWLGPEFLASGDDSYTEMRLGGHITSVRFSSYEFSLGAGWAKDNDGRSGAYGRVGVLYRPYGGASYPERPVPF